MTMQRQNTMTNMSAIKEHMLVVCKDGNRFAMVDHVDGNSIKLTRDDQSQHHWIPADWVDHVDDKVHLNRPADQAMRDWANTPPQTTSR